MIVLPAPAAAPPAPGLLLGPRREFEVDGGPEARLFPARIPPFTRIVPGLNPFISGPFGVPPPGTVLIFFGFVDTNETEVGNAGFRRAQFFRGYGAEARIVLGAVGMRNQLVAEIAAFV